MAKTILYHNPRCSKSRQALALLEDKDINFDTIEYLKAPLTKSQIKNLIELLAIEPRELIRTTEAEYKENNLADPALSNNALIAAIAEHPKLMQRPIVVHNNKAKIGRPPEAIMEIL